MTVIGYARVSTRGQNLQRQIEELENFGCDIIYCEKKSAVRDLRPEYEKMLDSVKSGDTLVVIELSRISRRVAVMYHLEDYFRTNNINLISLTEPHIGFDTGEKRLAYHMTVAFSEYEWEKTLERTEHGVKSARKRGVKFGRKNVK